MRARHEPQRLEDVGLGATTSFFIRGGAANFNKVLVDASLENLLDRDYEPTFGFPALPVTARVGFRVTFGGDLADRIN